MKESIKQLVYLGAFGYTLFLSLNILKNRNEEEQGYKFMRRATGAFSVVQYKSLVKAGVYREQIIKFNPIGQSWIMTDGEPFGNLDGKVDRILLNYGFLDKREFLLLTKADEESPNYREGQEIFDRLKEKYN